ncbi:YcdB/YcdC domain-containing protein [Paenibacillus sp. SAF-054]|uniref:YcdB/YcdC domain-containing protein n=1 Tax=unclassified Paenibacillus TaxID=185978 RepID=UPI003F7D24E3
MKDRNHSAGMPLHRTEARSLRSGGSVAKKWLAGTIGLSLLQMPLLVSAAPSTAPVVTESKTQSSQGSGSAATKGLNPADAKITKEQAEARARSLFPILKEARLVRVDYGQQNVFPANNKKIWVLNWSIEKGNGSSGFSTDVDALTGDILSFYYPYMVPQDDTNTAYYPPAVSKQAAEKIAQAFIAKAAPSIKAGTMKPFTNFIYPSNQTLFGPVLYTFSYSIDVNGIPSDNEYVSLDVDGNGNVIRFSRNTYQGIYPSAKAAISKEEAEKQLKQGLSAKLAYIPATSLYSASTHREWKLGYIPDRVVEPFDANAGKRIDTIYGTVIDAAGQAVSYSPLTPSKKMFTRHAGGEMTADEALQRVKEIAPGSEYQLQSHLGNGSYGFKQVWNLDWNKRNSGAFPGDNKHATVDAESGQLLSYYDYYRSETNTTSAPVITENQAKSKAVELVLAHYPNAANVLKLSNVHSSNAASSKSVYQFVFQRFYKELPINGSVVNVSIDGSGKLLRYDAESYLSEADFKSMDGLKAAVTPEEAQKRMLEEISVELRYISSGGYTVDSTYVEPTVRLAYVPTLHEDRNIGYINGVTGKSETINMLPSPNRGQSTALPSDAVNHAASKDLATLLEYRVLSPMEDGLLHPDSTLTLGEWIQMMANGVSPDQGYSGGSTQKIYSDVPLDSPLASALQLFSGKGWLGDTKSSELHPEQQLTREAVAGSLATALHYDRLSKFLQQDAQVLSLSDANAIQNKGAVALMLKFGLMEAAGGKFDPAKPVTRAEAATILVRLAHLQGKVDTPLNQ